MTSRTRTAAACAQTGPGRLPVDVGGFAFGSIHDVQAMTPIENLMPMFETVAEYR